MLDRQTVEETQTQLLRRIAAQERQALGEFYDQMAGVLYSTAFRILGDAQEAEEAIQDVFVQIWNNAATFDDGLGAPLHWALGITRHRAIDRLRARQRRWRVLEDAAQESQASAGDSRGPGEDSWSAEESTRVRAAVKLLPSEQRQAIEMAFFGGMTHQEISESLHEPLGTVKARIRRGMLKLRDDLKADI